MLIILVISVAFVSIYLLVFREKDESHMKVDRAWLEENIWQVESYKEMRNGKYDIYLLEVQPGDEDSWDKLCYNFTYAPYTFLNHYYLAEGVNCQGMVVHLADWCERNEHEYSVAWTSTHTFIFIKHDAQWYKFDFDTQGASMTEIEAADVKKGMIGL